MRVLRLLSLALGLSLLLPAMAHAQDKAEQLKKIKEDLKKQQQEIEFIQEQHETMKNKQYDQLSKEKQKADQERQQKEEELQRSLQEINKSKDQIKQAQDELAKKSAEAQLSQQELEQRQKEINRAREALQHQEDSIRLLTQEKELQDLELNNQRLANQQQQQQNTIYLAFLALGAVVLAGVIVLYLINRKKNKQLAEKNKVIEEEKHRSEELLLNILPQDLVNELKTQGKTNPKSYPMATVLFADIKDFTKISETLTPEELVSSLAEYFEAFDKIIDHSNVEKIKTIGDAYVCVGGVPVENAMNPSEVVRIGLQFQAAVLRLKEEREKKGQQCFDVRIGIHTGPLVAGVVGIRKFAYDIWGDTVNMAARMQQFGEPYQINISKDTYDIIKEKFVCIYRGKVEIKGKGEVDMYFVDKEL